MANMKSVDEETDDGLRRALVCRPTVEELADTHDPEVPVFWLWTEEPGHIMEPLPTPYTFYKLIVLSLKPKTKKRFWDECVVLDIGSFKLTADQHPKNPEEAAEIERQASRAAAIVVRYLEERGLTVMRGRLATVHGLVLTHGKAGFLQWVEGEGWVYRPEIPVKRSARKAPAKRTAAKKRGVKRAGK